MLHLASREPHELFAWESVQCVRSRVNTEVAGYTPYMNSQRDAQPDSHDRGADPIDQEAAQIDARSEDAPEKIEELIDHAEDLGRDAQQPVDPDADDEPEVLPG